MSRFSNSILCAVLLLGFLAPRPPAHASPLGCEGEIAKASSNLVRARMKALQKCEDGVVAGKVAPPCPDVQAATAIVKAESKLRASIDKKCGGVDKRCGSGGDDESLSAIGWDLGVCPNLAGAACTGVLTSCADVSECLSCMSGGAVAQAIALYYEDLALPGPNKVVTKCQRDIGKGAAKFFADATKHLHKCADGVLQGKIAGPCLDATAAAQTAKAESKMSAMICKSCGGADRLCGGGDDLTPATLGFPADCPAVTIPDGVSCGGPIFDLQDLVACVACVTAFEAECTGIAAVPGALSYPLECNPLVVPTVGATPSATRTPTPIPTASATPSATASSTPIPTASATPTATGSSTPTPNPTATPVCGNGILELGEICELALGCGPLEVCVPCSSCELPIP